jgi:hypothetical protein
LGAVVRKKTDCRVYTEVYGRKKGGWSGVDADIPGYRGQRWKRYGIA